MTVSDPGVLDIACVREGRLFLIISDHLEWGGETGPHLVALQEKLNLYVACIESGEVWDLVRPATVAGVTIEIVLKFSPPSIFVSFVDLANGQLPDEMETTISWRMGPSPEDGL